MTITNHGLIRVKERAGIGKSTRKTQRLIENAYRRGYRREDIKGELRKYLDEKYQAYEYGNNMRLYGGQLYIFEDDRLITMYSLPGSIQKNIKTLKSKSHALYRIRNNLIF